jgi:hypothetical protein
VGLSYAAPTLGRRCCAVVALICSVNARQGILLEPAEPSYLLMKFTSPPDEEGATLRCPGSTSNSVSRFRFLPPADHISPMVETPLVPYRKVTLPVKQTIGIMDNDRPPLIPLFTYLAACDLQSHRYVHIIRNHQDDEDGVKRFCTVYVICHVMSDWHYSGPSLFRLLLEFSSLLT